MAGSRVAQGALAKVRGLRKTAATRLRPLAARCFALVDEVRRLRGIVLEGAQRGINRAESRGGGPDAG